MCNCGREGLERFIFRVWCGLDRLWVSSGFTTIRGKTKSFVKSNREYCEPMKAWSSSFDRDTLISVGVNLIR